MTLFHQVDSKLLNARSILMQEAHGIWDLGFDAPYIIDLGFDAPYIRDLTVIL